jgi:flagellar basal-body rod protein FlgG
MMRALYTAAAGMAAQQFNIDTISNNIANVNTTGFRTNQARFQDLIYQQLRAAGTPVGSSQVPVAQEVGLGVKVSSSAKIFTQGTIQQTNNPLDVAIEGDGFFQVTKPDGTTAYTRDGSFSQNANGSIVTSDGYFLNPQITVPAGALQVGVNPDGSVTAVLPGATAPSTLDSTRALHQ